MGIVFYNLLSKSFETSCGNAWLYVTDLVYQKTTVSRVFLEVLKILYVKFKFLIHWLDPLDRK